MKLLCVLFLRIALVLDRKQARDIKPKKWLACKDKPIEKLLKCIDAFPHTRGKTLSNKFEMRKKKIRTRVSRA